MRIQVPTSIVGRPHIKPGVPGGQAVSAAGPSDKARAAADPQTPAAARALVLVAGVALGGLHLAILAAAFPVAPLRTVAFIALFAACAAGIVTWRPGDARSALIDSHDADTTFTVDESLGFVATTDVASHASESSLPEASGVDERVRADCDLVRLDKP